MSQSTDSRPIGIFDSGLGGLTLLTAIHNIIEQENIIYLADTARLPYGIKSEATVTDYSISNVELLLKENVKCIVVACNTASAYALDHLKKRFTIPIIGVIDSGVARAVKVSDGSIGVIGTESTIRSNIYERLIKDADSKIKVYSKACPLFVPLVEEGWVDNEITRLIAKKYLTDFQGKVDTIILGCTHYPHLRGTIGKLLGSNITLVDSANETAKLLKEQLIAKSLLSNSSEEGQIIINVTDSPERTLKVAKRFTQDKIKIDSLKLVNI
ncbi:MAG: glutamate racemase [Nitrospinota bacterium]